MKYGFKKIRPVLSCGSKKRGDDLGGVDLLPNTSSALISPRTRPSLPLSVLLMFMCIHANPHFDRHPGIFLPRTYSPSRTMSPPFLHDVGHSPFRRHHPLIYNVKRSAVNVYKIDTRRSVRVRCIDDFSADFF